MAVPGVGHARLRSAVEEATNAAATAAALRGMIRESTRGLRQAEVQRAEGWARVALRTIDRFGVHVLVPGMETYPESLKNLSDPPFVLFAAGRLELLASPLVAIVGTRSCTPRGAAMATRLGRGIADAGAVVVSGLALGIDGAAHVGAGAARTIAILGCGLDVAYPPRHRPLQRLIAREGLLLSEFLPGTPPAQFHFPRRNRLIAALAKALVVVEAPVKSGALSTVQHALDIGRQVFVVPGSSGSRASAGSNALIGDGAQLVTTAGEVVAGLDLSVCSPAEDEQDVAPEGLHGVGLALWRSLGLTPRHVDQLAAELGLEPRQSLASLLALEIQGHVRQLPGLRFARC